MHNLIILLSVHNFHIISHLFALSVECRASRRRSRMCERLYRRTLSPWIRQNREMHSFFETKENLYWTNRIESNSDDPKKLWRSMLSVLRRDGVTTVPPSLDVTAARLAQFFTEVYGVRSATENAPPPSFSLYYCGTQLTIF